MRKTILGLTILAFAGCEKPLPSSTIKVESGYDKQVADDVRAMREGQEQDRAKTEELRIAKRREDFRKEGEAERLRQIREEGDNLKRFADEQKQKFKEAESRFPRP